MCFKTYIFVIFAIICLGNAQEQKKEMTKEEEMKKAQMQDHIETIGQFYHPEAIDHYTTLFHGSIIVYKSLTMEIPGRTKECIYETIQKFDHAHIQFESTHDIPIALVEVKDPQNKVIVQEKHTKELDYSTQSNMTGDYSICFHNTRGIKNMVVKLAVEVQELSNIASFHLSNQKDDNATMYHLYDKLWQIQHDLGRFEKAISFNQRIVRHDWDLMQEKEWYISTGSIVIMLTIILSSFVQVYFVRNMFNDTKPRRPLRAGDNRSLYSGMNRSNGNPVNSTTLSM